VTLLSATVPVKASIIETAQVGTKIYLFGGATGSKSKTNGIHVFDTTTETITTLDVTLPNAMTQIGVCVVGEKIYLFGGRGTSTNYSTICEFDTTTDTITVLDKTMPNACYGMATALVGTKIYLFCGYSSSYSYGFTNKIFEFDLVTHDYKTLEATFPLQGYDLSAVVIGAKIYLFGGYGEYNNNGIGNLDTIVEFDPKTMEATVLDQKLPSAASNISTAVLGSGVYMVIDNKVTVFVSSTPLASGTMVLQHTGTGAFFPIINSNVLTVEVGVAQVYCGDENGAAQPTEAFIYKDDAWTSI
jgi:N-acetylneuraminic acid mutarotase